MIAQIVWFLSWPALIAVSYLAISKILEIIDEKEAKPFSEEQNKRRQ
jgi:hypothetical protein